MAMDMLKIFLWSYLPGILSVSIASGSYTDYLYHKYGKPVKDKYINRNPKIEDPLWKRPLRLNYEKRYPLSSKRRKRFLYFLFLTRMNYIITNIFTVVMFLCMVFGLGTYDTLVDIAVLKMLIIDGFCILCCIPFGLIVYVICLVIDIWFDSDTSSCSSHHMIDIWWG